MHGSAGEHSRMGLARVALIAAVAALAVPASASAGEPILGAADYPGMTTFKCRTDADPDLARAEPEPPG